MEYLKVIVLSILLSGAVITDTESYKIRNGYLVIGSILGFLLNFITKGYSGLVFSLLGLILPIIILFFLFILHMLGAGDIKLFATIGAIMGVKFVSFVILYSFIIGGIIAFCILVFKKTLLIRLNYFFSYVKRCILNKNIEVYYQANQDNYGQVMHFSYFIAISVIIQIYCMKYDLILIDFL